MSLDLFFPQEILCDFEGCADLLSYTLSWFITLGRYCIADSDVLPRVAANASVLSNNLTIRCVCQIFPSNYATQGFFFIAKGILNICMCILSSFLNYKPAKTQYVAFMVLALACCQKTHSIVSCWDCAGISMTQGLGYFDDYNNWHSGHGRETYGRSESCQNFMTDFVVLAVKFLSICFLVIL